MLSRTLSCGGLEIKQRPSRQRSWHQARASPYATRASPDYHPAMPLDEDHTDRWWDDWPADLIFEYIEAEERGDSDRLLLGGIARLPAGLPVTES